MFSEVAARFTLDAMPGKQMSIDAESSAGLISENEAKDRESKIQQEAIFMALWMEQVNLCVEMPLQRLCIVINIVGGF